MTKPITIVGGGLAGLTLGIGLRQRDVPVTLWEAGHYPRHRVCGEFISGRGLESLDRLGLRRLLEAAGAVSAHSAAFYSTTRGTSPRRLPSTALCLSRHVLDDLLAKAFCNAGGELRAGERWPGKEFVEGVVRATGRRAQRAENGARWFGLKAHARNVALTADLEMHVAPNGYVGMCRINGGEVNVCGLFRRAEQTAKETPEASAYFAKYAEARDRHAILRGIPGSPLNGRLEFAVFDDHSLCAVAGLSLRPHRAGERGECCIGDAITMIPPVTGNGMSMAFESAELAMEPLTRWSRGEISWPAAQEVLARRCDATFARRLAWARWLQTLILSARGQRLLPLLWSRGDWLWRFWFERTR